jgi:hypothetical protein
LQPQLVLYQAEVAHLVEHNLAKVGVAGSSPVFRSEILSARRGDFFWSPGGGIGRHAGLKILWPAMAVTVQLRSGARIITLKCNTVKRFRVFLFISWLFS